MTEFKPPTWREDTDAQVLRLLAYVIIALGLIIVMALWTGSELSRMSDRITALERAQQVKP